VSITQYPIPEGPITLDEVIERYPTLRQSLLGDYDDCALYSYFRLRYSQVWSTHPQARGTIFHRFAAECLRTMRAQDSEQIPISEAMVILEEVLEQRNIEPMERVRLPLREIPVVRMAAIKFAKDNRFTVRNIIDIEKRMEATLTYVDDEGTLRERRLSGMPDVIVKDPQRPQDGVVVIDWKDTWALPPKRKGHEKDAAEAGLSYHGYFQQRFYAWLILKTYPAINVVTLREFYARRSKTRPATVGREKLEEIEEELGNLAREFDRSLMAGKPSKLSFPEVENWKPSPGKHCFWCPAARYCPIEDVPLETIVARTPDQAKATVAVLEVAEAIARQAKAALRPLIEETGPVASKASKGRRVYGLRTNKAGTPEARFFTPEGSDRAPARLPEDDALENALRKAAEQVEEERGDE
jgi:hypothetical protein